MYKKTSQITNSWCTGNSGEELYSEFLDKITSVTPSERQLEFLNMKYYNFIHFGINTFYNREWGNGKEDISIFNPQQLDTDQWCKVLKSTGSKGIIITAKHHDGFCLFDTKYTKHSVMYTPYKKDIVKMLSESCKKYDLKFGVYLSPWDRHESTYGTAEYNDYFVNQLTELCTNYGELFCLWFDGACGEGKNGKKQIYDWERYYSVIRKLQPNAVISITGPDVRWIGNEGGKVRTSEYSVIPSEKDSAEVVAENSQHDVSETKKMAAKLSETDEDLGSRAVLAQFSDYIFKPAEADVSINLGWFHTSKIFSHARKQRSAKELATIFFNSVGGNASMLLNVPPDKNGLINKREIKKLQKFTKLISEPFQNELETESITCLTTDNEQRKILSSEHKFSSDEMGICLNFKCEEEIKSVFIAEDLSYSQRIEKFELYSEAKGEYTLLYTGSVIGSGKIIRLKEKVKAERIILVPTQSRKEPVILKFKCF